MNSLERLAREFVDSISDLLNRTVTHGVRLSSMLHRPGLVLAGVGLGKGRLKPGIIRLTLGGKDATAYLMVGYALAMDRDDRFLTVQKSTYSVFADDLGRETFFHYDYNATPRNPYAGAHVQVVGASPALAAIRHRVPKVAAKLEDLHFPVGGRRFRPTLEDVVEFLVVEQIARAHRGWEDAVEHHRESWHEAQVKGAVRRYPTWASEALAGEGWEIRGPGQSGERS